MRKSLIIAGILILYGIFAVSGSLGSERINVKGLNNCEKLYYDEIGSSKPKTNYIFLVTGFRIEYSGSNSFSVDPNYFSLLINNVQYPNSGATYYLDKKGLTPLPSVTLRGGGRVEGYIAYEIPKDKKNEKYDVVYTGWEDVKIDYTCA